MTPGGQDGITGVSFDSDGHRLVGVLYLARGDEPGPTALLLHGCPGLEQNLDIAAALRDRGWNALVFHYRGCWGSAGRYDLRTITADVRAAVDHLRAGEHPGVDPGRLAVVGHSLGGWAAILAAAADPRLRAVVACAAPAGLGSVQVGVGQLDRDSPGSWQPRRPSSSASAPRSAGGRGRSTSSRRSRRGRCSLCTAVTITGFRLRTAGHCMSGRQGHAAMSKSTERTTRSPGTAQRCGIW